MRAGQQSEQAVKALIQRVSESSVRVAGEEVGAIGRGLLVLLGVERGDTEENAARLGEKLLNYRVFPDDEGRMNLSVQAMGGGLLVVSQFTLAADTRKGLRPGFSGACPPEEAERLYDWLVNWLRERHAPVATGRFQADMQVQLVNDGPVTFLLEVPPH